MFVVDFALDSDMLQDLHKSYIFSKTLFINAGFQTDNAKNMQNTEQLFRIASNFQTLSSGNVTCILVLTCLGWK